MAFLSSSEKRALTEELEFYFSLPYASHLAGTAWEEMLATVKGGTWTQMQDNRPRPDLKVIEAGKTVNYSVKTEVLKPRGTVRTAEDFLGRTEDLIVARPKVDDLLQPGESIGGLPPDELGSRVLSYYNEKIVREYEWHVLSVLFNIGNREFIYFEERPPEVYNPEEYWWKDSGRATGENRNINGYPLNSPHDTTERAKFKWTSGGKQFYILYKIPRNADIIHINPAPLSVREAKKAFRIYIQKKSS